MDGLRNLTGLAIPLLLLVCVGNADAQHKPLKEQVVGVWSLVSARRSALTRTAL